jgi:hypothetical protein
VAALDLIVLGARHLAEYRVRFQFTRLVTVDRIFPPLQAGRHFDVFL